MTFDDGGNCETGSGILLEIVYSGKKKTVPTFALNDEVSEEMEDTDAYSVVGETLDDHCKHVYLL